MQFLKMISSGFHIESQHSFNMRMLIMSMSFIGI